MENNTLTKAALKPNAKFLLSDYFFKLEKKVFQQEIKIPIGLNLTLFFANLSLAL